MKRIGLALVVFVSMAGWVAYHYDKPEIAVGETISVADIDACKDAYTSQRYSDALQDCRRLAEEGQSRALYLLADMYRNGLGVQKHMGMAATWYRRAAEEGQSRAQYLLADMYRNGLGVQKDTGMAATWYRRAAEQGHTGAQVSLDLMLALDIHSISQMDGGGGPRVCLEFTETLLPIRSSALGDYVRIEPRVKLAASVSGRDLCLSGLSYGQKYGVTIKAGLRGDGGFVVGADRKIDFKVHDREPEITFDTRKYVLPTGVSRGLPVRTVNLDAIDVKLYRVDARMLTQLQPWILGKINGSKFAQLRDDLGELLWRGSVVVENKPNADVTTLLDLASVADVDGPGIYVVAATIPGEGMWRWTDVPTQWFVQSDIGISTYTARDGLHVRLRSLETGEPLANGRLTLLARNNKELGSVQTDHRGLASLAPGLMRGDGGNAPAVLTAQTPGNDFNFLILSKSVLDISDRDVAGRPYPGPIDAYVYTERGVYRPGEAVHIYGIVRDQRTGALTEAKDIGEKDLAAYWLPEPD